MKIPLESVNAFKITRVFPPAIKPTGWNTLYAEFESSAATEFIQQFARFLQPGKQINIYVPQKLQMRFRAINSLAHSFRKGSLQHKNRVRYGIDDFTLLVRPKTIDGTWSYASLDSLPPFQFSPIHPSNSPPIGRPLKKKRTRSGENDSRSSRPRTDNEIAAPTDRNPNSEEVIPEVSGLISNPPHTEALPESEAEHQNPIPSYSASNSSQQLDSAPPNNYDLGSFQPSACLSPSAAKNQNFTFTTRSLIPKSLNSKVQT